MVKRLVHQSIFRSQSLTAFGSLFLDGTCGHPILYETCTMDRLGRPFGIVVVPQIDLSLSLVCEGKCFRD